ncbi:hypothetical protein NCCP1664_10480 [Zafaria cholistanensis]|uniref:HTH tetR-type domain-containing protein n=1 Tax=Zafaria cholistanensis TaxID=1682741 RepID=A0A5A7NS38_9MICC|nr:TetR/AcrR family transcriptional regulator [Zafaria cholistanensis]GER22551.1 hypothetical protein NCCP1664_10480 [Zafaria cholistanensis]
MSEENRAAGRGPDAGTSPAGIPAAGPSGAGAQDVRQRILEAAIDLFGVRGVAGTPTRAIAEAAGVSTSLLLHHYISKDSLAVDCEDYVVRTILEENLGGHGPAEAAARLLDDPKLESRLRFIARQVTDGSRSGGRMFDRLVKEAKAGISRDPAGMRWKATSDPDVLAVVLAMHAMAPLLLADHLARHFGTVPYSAETLRRMGPVLMELYANGIIEPNAGGARQPSGPEAPGRPGGGRHAG